MKTGSWVINDSWRTLLQTEGRSCESLEQSPVRLRALNPWRERGSQTPETVDCWGSKSPSGSEMAKKRSDAATEWEKEADWEGDKACPVAQTCSLRVIFTRVFTLRFCEFSSLGLSEWDLSSEMWSSASSVRFHDRERGRERNWGGRERSDRVLHQHTAVLGTAVTTTMVWERPGQQEEEEEEVESSGGTERERGEGCASVTPFTPHANTIPLTLKTWQIKPKTLLLCTAQKSKLESEVYQNGFIYLFLSENFYIIRLLKLKHINHLV